MSNAEHMSALLSTKEIQALTGYSQKDKQESWLRDNGVHFMSNSKGVVVARYWLDRAPFEKPPNVTHIRGKKPDLSKIGNHG